VNHSEATPNFGQGVWRLDLLAISIPISTSLFVVGSVAVVFLTAFLLSGILGPTPEYEISNTDQLPSNDSPEFPNLLELLVDAKVNHGGSVKVLRDGPCFYDAQLEVIRKAERSVNLEAYIFQRGSIGRQYLEAITERAKSGIHVNLLLDAFGSAGTTNSFFLSLLEAGGKVRWYNSPTWYRLTRLDNRTHRELLIVDGRIGFVGGAGIADQWYSGSRGKPRWRDTMVQVEGDAVPHLQATFAENWVTANGEVLIGDAYFPTVTCSGQTTAMVINSTPTVGGATRARMLFQLLLASARHSISITTPYFLPDKSLTQELCCAIEQRCVKVRLLVPGRKSDHLLTRSASRAGYGPLLNAGAEIYEFQPAMIHAKVLCVDGLWAVIGSTNFDYRSFGINDEVNLAVNNTAFAQQLEHDMAIDLTKSRRISLDEWHHRPITDRVPELLGWIFERQQ
jgi:cardiolipin synthase A/B